LAAAASIFDQLDLSRLIDPQLKAWARSHRFAGSGDRRAIADRVFSVLRRRRSSAAVFGSDSGRALVLGSLVTEDGLSADAISELCGGSYGLDPLNSSERDALVSGPSYESDAARLDWPDWLYSQAQAAFGDALPQELDALRKRAALDVRVNTLRGTRDQARDRLAREDDIAAEPVATAHTALRLAPATSIQRSDAFLSGLIEPQDAASQAVAFFANAQPGQRVLDFCAGAGGKTLAFAAQMKNQGALVAHDVNPKRMADIPNRAARAGATIIRRAAKAGLSKDYFDTVLIDAPCSGSGSWRRDPLGKWRLTPERLIELQSAQREALASAADHVKPGGLLTYATCSVLPSENRDQVDSFLSGNSAFRLEETLNLWPARDNCDGFFAARFRKQV
jgi:16S rRNA (cytosine967-C5)-methyltransferase